MTEVGTLTGDFGVFIFGTGAFILFMIGYFFTIKEFNELEPEDDPGSDAHLRE